MRGNFHYYSPIENIMKAIFIYRKVFLALIFIFWNFGGLKLQACKSLEADYCRPFGEQ